MPPIPGLEIAGSCGCVLLLLVVFSFVRVRVVEGEIMRAGLFSFVLVVVSVIVVVLCFWLCRRLCVDGVLCGWTMLCGPDYI